MLDERATVVDRPGAIDLVAPRGAVEFDDVTLAYATGEPVLRHFDLRVEPGETVAIVGRTGSGKSTVARLLTRFYDVQSGSVRIDGHDVHDLTLTSVRHHVGVVLDDPFLFDRVTARQHRLRPARRLACGRGARGSRHAGRGVRGRPGPGVRHGGRRTWLRPVRRATPTRVDRPHAVRRSPAVLVLDDATSAIKVHVEQQIHGTYASCLLGSAHRRS